MSNIAIALSRFQNGETTAHEISPSMLTAGRVIAIRMLLDFGAQHVPAVESVFNGCAQEACLAMIVAVAATKKFQN